MAGCIAMKTITVDGMDIAARVLEAGCSAVSGEWRVRAETR